MEAVIATVVTVIGGGIFGLVNHLFTKKTEDAKNAVNANTAQVEAANSALEGMERLLNNYRIEEEKYKQRIEDLEHDIREERQLNVGLMKRLEELANAGKQTGNERSRTDEQQTQGDY